jgi:hypothetical protein
LEVRVARAEGEATKDRAEIVLCRADRGVSKQGRVEKWTILTTNGFGPAGDEGDGRVVHGGLRRGERQSERAYTATYGAG